MSKKKVLYMPLTTRGLPNIKEILVNQQEERREAIRKWEEDIKKITKLDFN